MDKDKQNKLKNPDKEKEREKLKDVANNEPENEKFSPGEAEGYNADDFATD